MAVSGEGDFEAELKGEFHWELFMDIDNTTNSGAIKREVEVETVVALSHKNMVRSLKSSTIGQSIGLDVGGKLFDVLNVGVKGNLSSEVKSEYENITNSKAEKTTTTKKTDSYTVKGKGVLKLYRLMFTGPGVAYATDTISSTPDPHPEVPIEIHGRKIPVLKDIQVVYTSDVLSRPDDIIQEMGGHDADLNKELNQSGASSYSYVWLRPVWTYDVTEGVTGIQVSFQPKQNAKYNDLKGSGKVWRYLKMLRDPHSKRRITEVALWRRSYDDWTNFADPSHYQCEANLYIFAGFKDMLYLKWNVRELQ